MNIDIVSMGGTHWTYFLMKVTKSHYFDSFGGPPDKFLLQHLPKPLTCYILKIQDINSRLCGAYCLYFSCLKGTMASRNFF